MPLRPESLRQFPGVCGFHHPSILGLLQPYWFAVKEMVSLNDSFVRSSFSSLHQLPYAHVTFLVHLPCLLSGGLVEQLLPTSHLYALFRLTNFASHNIWGCQVIATQEYVIAIRCCKVEAVEPFKKKFI